MTFQDRALPADYENGISCLSQAVVSFACAVNEFSGRSSPGMWVVVRRFLRHIWKISLLAIDIVRLAISRAANAKMRYAYT